MMQRTLCTMVAALALLGNAPASFAGAPSGFPSTPRLQGLFIAGTRVYPVLWAVKQNTEQRNTTTTIADDAELTITLEASKYYWVTMVIKVCGSTSGAMGFRFRWVAPGGVDLSSQGIINHVVLGSFGGASVPMIETADNVAGTISVCNTLDVLHRSGVILTSSAGVLKLQWAQSTSNALNTNVFRGSYISAQKLN